MRKIVTILLVLILSLGAVACGGKKNTGNGGGNSGSDKMSDLALITPVVASEKIMADKDVEEYSNVMRDELRIDTAKNEYESGQIMISAKEDLYFSVSTNDLVNVTDSSKKIAKENLNIFIEKYIFVPRIYHQNGADAGEYPDALLPHDNAVEYGLNLVKKGQNGVAYIEVYTPKDTPAGIYTGNVTVKIGNASQQVPIKVVVYDYELSDETTSQSVFIVTTGAVIEHELDDTEEMYQKYLDLLAKSRVSPSSFLMYQYDTPFEEYMDVAIKYLDKGMNSIPLRLRGETINGQKTFSSSLLYNDILAFAERSLADGENYVKRLNLYNACIDEPFFINYGKGTINLNIDRFIETREQVKEELSSRAEFQTELGAEIINSLDDVRHVITDYYDNDYDGSGGHRYDNAKPPLLNPDGSLFTYDGKDVVLCPKFDAFDTDQDFINYRKQAEEFNNEIWFYGCNNPYYPYPSYHLEDTLTSAMSIGWMMAEYNIVGNLYWSVNCHFDYGNTLIEDPYQVPHRGSGANGEGAIVYPGKQFGVDGPVSSLRMEAVREGNEDYELLEDLKAIYAEKGADASGVIKLLTEKIYSYASVIGGANDYESSRKLLLKALEVASSDAGLLITEYNREVSQNGEKYSAKVKVSEGTKLFFNGQELTATSNNEYSVFIEAINDKNYLSLEAVKGNVTATIDIYLSGKQTVFEKDTYNDSVITSKEDILSQGLSADWYDVAIVNKEKAKVAINHVGFATLDKDTDKLRIYVFNPHTEAKKYTLYVTYSEFGKVQHFSGTLTPGENMVDLTFFKDVDWAKRGSVSNIEFAFNNMDSVGIGNMILFKV